MLASGDEDGVVIYHDWRIKNHIVGKMLHHTGAVCSLAWSPDGTYLASGANDNTLCITEGANFHSMNTAPKHVLTGHQAAVKALAWSPHERHLLASAGGEDGAIKLWDASSGSLVNSVNTGSRVSAVAWNPFEQELLSAHGAPFHQLSLWKVPSLVKSEDFVGHDQPVVDMVISADGTVCSGSLDKYVHVWKIFTPPPPEPTQRRGFASTGVNFDTSACRKMR